MDVYLKRIYGNQSVPSNENEGNYPFWDYRSCRRKSTIPGSQDSEGTASSVTENANMIAHTHTTHSNALNVSWDPCPVTLHIITESHHNCHLQELYQQVINWVDPQLKLVRITERENTCYQEVTHSNARRSDNPAIAVTVFLRGADQDGEGSYGLEDARQLFQHPPWRFHHSEKLNQGNMNVLSNNSQDFYYTSHDLPLWAVRQVHYGREHIRYVLYTSDSSWPDQVQFYKLILGRQPDLLRDDFCLFTVYTQENYDVQFALKKLDSNLRILTLQSVHIHVKINDAGHLVPLFPNVCRQISDVKWQTTDHDGNIVVLDVNQAISHTDSNITKLTSSHKSKVVVNRDHHFTCERYSGYQKVGPYLENHHKIASLPLQNSDLLLKLMNSQHLSYSQQLEISALSDEDDLDIDLPSPPLRCVPKMEDDETSLTLTNTSEESGIHMQNGSEDLSFYEEEGLRSCLSKSSSLKVRHVKFKVRFKEEVESFEDTSCWLSSGVDSEDQSDIEMETRFPYVPSVVEQSVNSKDFSSATGHYTAADTGRLASVHESLCSGTDIKHFHPDCSLVKHSLAMEMCKVQSCQSCLNSSINRCVDNTIISHTDSKNNVQEKMTSHTNIMHGSYRHRTNHQLHRVSHSHQCSSPMPPVNTSMHNGSSSVENICLGRSHLSSVAQHPICHQCPRSTHQTLTNSQHTFPPTEIRNTPSFSSHLANNQKIPSRSSSENTPAKDNKDRQHQNRTSSDVNILQKESPSATPPVRDNRTKLLSTDSNRSENKRLPGNCTKSDLLQDVPNGQKKFWFADSNLELARNGCSGHEDTTLKFTLKFDTCPTSGLSSGEEQIGFYV